MRVVAIGLLLSLSCSVAGAEGPVGFRSDGTGRFPETTPPLTWGPDTAVQWKTAMPSWSNASPVVCGDRVYVCAEPDRLLCLQLSDGKLLWDRANPARGASPKAHRANGYTSATPVCDGTLAHALFGTGLLVCYDTAGKRRWFYPVATPSHKWGHSASPVRVGGLVIAHVENTLAAFDAATGRPRWELQSRQAWGTPLVHTVGTRQVLLMPGGDCVDALTGKRLASGLGKLTYAAPVARGDVIYYCDPNAVAVRLTDDGQGGVKTEKLWQATLGNRRNRFYASAIIHDEYLYALERGGTLSVIEAATGKIAYKQRLELGRGTCYPSLVIAGKRLIASCDNGQSVVLEPGPVYKAVASSRLDGFRATPTPVGKNRMLIRTTSHLYCLVGSEAK